MEVTREIKESEVIQNSKEIFKFDLSKVDRLVERASKNARKRIRVNLHHSASDGLHEMIIVHFRDNYIPPHKHSNKSESFHLIKGELDVVLFDSKGDIREIVPMGDGKSNKAICYRIIPDIWHSIVPRTESVVFHEVTGGPFIPNQTDFPNWAPRDDFVGTRPNAVLDFQRDLEVRIARFNKETG